MASRGIFFLPPRGSFSNTDLIMPLPLRSFHGLPYVENSILTLSMGFQTSSPTSVSSHFAALSFLPPLPLALAFSFKELTFLLSSALVYSYSPSSGPLDVTSFSTVCPGTIFLSVVGLRPNFQVFSFLCLFLSVWGSRLERQTAFLFPPTRAPPHQNMWTPQLSPSSQGHLAKPFCMGGPGRKWLVFLL